MMKIFARTALAAAIIAFGATSSRAELVYGVTLLDNQLISVDTTTGLGTLVAPLSQPINPFGLASVNNQLFTFDSVDDLIQRIDPTTGGIVASTNIGIGPVLGQGGLAMQSSTVGYLTSALNADPTSSTYLNATNNLYRFNLATGTTTLVAQTTDTLESIAFGPNGTLYGLGKLDGNLYQVNPTTGFLTVIGSLGLSIGSPVGAITFDPAGNLLATIDDAIYQLNLTTGAATRLGSAPNTSFFSISGLAFASPSATVPEPGSALLLGLGLGLGVVGASGRWIRKRSTRLAA